MDKLDTIKAFIRVYEVGSFSKAAQHMNIGQPAISKAIAQLEQAIGAQLLLRSTRELTPTQAGENFYLFAKEAIEKLEEAELSAMMHTTTMRGRLKVCAAVTFSRLYIIPHLSKFMDLYPEIEIEMLLDDKVNDLIKEGIDIALRMGALTDSTLKAKKIGQCRRRVFASPKLIQRCGGPPATPADLVHYPAVLYTPPEHSITAWHFKKNCRVETIIPQGRIRVNAAEGAREAVKSGLGVTIASEWMFGPELHSGHVIPLLEEWTLPDMTLWAVTPQGRHSNAKAHLFIKFLLEIIKDVPRAAAFPGLEHSEPVKKPTPHEV